MAGAALKMQTLEVAWAAMFVCLDGIVGEECKKA